MLLRRAALSPFLQRSTFSPHSTWLRYGHKAEPCWIFVRSYTTTQTPKVKLTISTPSNVFFKDKPVDKVKIPGATGDFVLLPNHVPYISELRPGLIIVENDKQQEKFFVSGGFVFFHKNSICSVNAAECVPLEQLDLEAAQKALSKWQAQFNSATNDKDKAVARIAMETANAICQALQSQK